jgi:hypothetical protein
MSRETLYIIMIASGVGSIIALGYAQYSLYKANKHLYKATKSFSKAKMIQCKHKWGIPPMYCKNNYYNPTECAKCGKLIRNIDD